ncbi:hypothetical protein RRG08_065527 [Elysia crispata]|uniref:Apple domain-containing protein n=1 Tax=Elysia crispata TaxID=231223 RepID=A0AAE1DYZ8_9GAST|nr:hypothetical protein RRG08_065527 [Elysia crispata]
MDSVTDKKRVAEVRGRRVQGKEFSGTTSIVTKVPSFTHCVMTCAQNYTCRYAGFNSDLLTCTILGPGSYDLNVTNQAVDTFIRDSFQ